MTKDQCKEVLENQLLPQMADWSKGIKIFMQDGATCHIINSVMVCSKHKKIDALPWPGNTPSSQPHQKGWGAGKARGWKKN